MIRKRKKKRLAVFDIDGTIFRKNLHFELINELAWMKVFPRSIRDRLVDLYGDWLEHRGTYEAYRVALVNLYAEHIAGCRVDDVVRASRAVVPFHKNRTYIFSNNLIKQLRRKNYCLIAISGSPLEIVEEYNRQYLGFDHVFGSVYETTPAGTYTGSATYEPSRDKGQVVKQYAYEEKVALADSYGIGDTESDAGFLELVTNPIAFNPNENLIGLAERHGWRIVVEKKDVVYEITNQRKS